MPALDRARIVAVRPPVDPIELATELGVMVGN